MIIEAVVKFFHKNFTARDVVFTLFIIALFLATRLINLDKFPIFNDEGIYIQWAKTAWHDASWRFISLTDGKQPLQTWGTIPLLKLFPDNALLAGRLFAVSLGSISLMGVFTLLFYLFGKKTAYIGALLYIFTPFFLFYDRLALVDSGVNAAFFWILFFSILLINTVRLDTALLFGLASGIFLLAKSSVKVFVGLSALAPLLTLTENTKKSLWRSLNYYFLFGIGCLLALVIYNVQRLSPFFHFVAEKNKVFVMTLGDFIKNPLAVLVHNLYTLPLYVSWEMGFVSAVLGLFGFVLVFQKDKKLFTYLFAWILLLYVGVSCLTIILYPRYLIFFAGFLTVTTAYFLSRNKNSAFQLICITALIISFAYFDFNILFDIKQIPFPQVDRGQYIESWTAGWGIKDIIDYARQKSQEKPVVILAEGDFGMSGDVLNVFVHQNDRIFIKGYWPLTLKNLRDNQQELKNNLVYIVISHQSQLPEGWPMKLIEKFDKPGHNSSIYLLELTK